MFAKVAVLFAALAVAHCSLLAYGPVHGPIAVSRQSAVISHVAPVAPVLAHGVVAPYGLAGRGLVAPLGLAGHGLLGAGAYGIGGLGVAAPLGYGLGLGKGLGLAPAYGGLGKVIL
ncbi:hypothetical protein JTE90_014375 [Oedothorax gibbosus]|uniref:Uncharacterized protein n=1 Tax=Oedothorax gibbosus TaxID=931172 RepID=A0AAV6UFC5_9ARAC|nr:hypothetical protein JTE90_014375 [Oedothorax gibbosus]